VGQHRRGPGNNRRGHSRRVHLRRGGWDPRPPQPIFRATSSGHAHVGTGTNSGSSPAAPDPKPYYATASAPVDDDDPGADDLHRSAYQAVHTSERSRARPDGELGGPGDDLIGPEHVGGSDQHDASGTIAERRSNSKRYSVTRESWFGEFGRVVLMAQGAAIG
jgi:hypothetical protein